MKAVKKKLVSEHATIAGATLGVVAGTAVGTGTGLSIVSHLGLCALGGMASCGLLLPIIGAAVGGVAAREWVEGTMARSRRAPAKERLATPDGQ